VKSSSKRQQQILSIISSFTEAKGFSPSYREIAQVLGLSSVGTVYKHIQNLKANGLLDGAAQKWRALKTTQELPSCVFLPVIGSVSKGIKIEISAKMSFFEVPEMMAPRELTCYGFIVQDNSFLDEQIVEKDLLIIEARNEPEEGEMILFSSKNEGARLGRYSINDDLYKIQGIVIGLLRSSLYKTNWRK
jgi:repressor LexA